MKNFVFTMQKLRRILTFALIIELVCFLVPVVYALCSVPKEEGNWRNIDANTRSITRLELDFVCQDQIINGQPCCPTGPPYYLHLYGSCAPTDCDWGSAGGRRIENGYLYFFYDQGFARRYVFVRMSQRYPGKLYVQIQTDFKDPNRPDYVSDDWFNKTSSLTKMSMTNKLSLKDSITMDSSAIITISDTQQASLKNTVTIQSSVKFRNEPGVKNTK